MNFYLLMACHDMDDIPVEAFETLEECQEAANTREIPTRNIWGDTCNTFECWAAVEFRKGLPVDRYRIAAD